jgi:FkbM family methyltransferase
VKIVDSRKYKNCSIFDEFQGYFHYIRVLIGAFLAYRRTYRNYLEICRHVFRKWYPVKAVFRNGDQAILTSHSQVSSIALLKNRNNIQLDIPNDIITIKSAPFEKDHKVEITLYGAISNGDVVNIFFQNSVYRSLPVMGKPVIDVGCNIADSALYFAMRGAEKVIGLEPYPKNYNTAMRNIEINNLSDKVDVLLAGCASKSGHVLVDPEIASGYDTHLEYDSKGRIEVPLMTLEQILGTNNLLELKSILKMDCEGCEYDAILSSPERVLQKFSYIQIEYHYGYKNLKNKLEASGFDVLVSKPMIDFSYNPRRVIGYIYAKRNLKAGVNEFP